MVMDVVGDTTYLDLMPAPHGPRRKPQGFDRETVRLEFLPNGLAYLAHSLTYVDASGGEHTAPEWMLTDGRTGPVVMRPPFHTKYLRCYVLHDHRCYLAAMMKPGAARDCARRGGDRLLWEAMRYREATASLAWVVYRAVRVGAWMSRRAPVLERYPLYDWKGDEGYGSGCA